VVVAAVINTPFTALPVINAWKRRRVWRVPINVSFVGGA
jgi:hypothetical protein